jgi:hypothetical protein
MMALGRVATAAMLLTVASTCTATEPLTLRLAQRASATLSDMPGEVRVTIGDITGGDKCGATFRTSTGPPHEREIP